MTDATRLLAGGFLTLAVAMGVGRFFYTPLLPLMQREADFGADLAGLLAAANFAGYLIGSVAASLVPRGRPRLWTFRAGVTLSVVTTLGMGMTDAMGAWLLLRTLSGIASALAMILAAGMVAEALAGIDDGSRIGWLFGGVGFGIAASTLLVRLYASRLSAAELWIAVGLAGVALLPVILATVGERRLASRPRRVDRRRRLPRPLSFAPLLVTYALEGLGYSVFATFIVAIVKSRPGMEAIGDWVWVMVGLAGVPSILFWSWTAERIGFGVALVLAYLAQIAGVLLPALSGAGWAALVAAVLFGGTFMAISALTVPLGRHGMGGRGFAVLTAGFGLGQMIGPLMAGYLAAGTGAYEPALLASAAALALGTAVLVWAVAVRER